MLEPLHACNLRCAGCGRIREYADTVHQRMTVEECLDSVDECGAPVVSVCGGEPLIYRELRELLEGILQRKKHIYLCTNGVLLEEKAAELPCDPRLYINVHLDGMEASHDASVQKEGVFSKAVKGIEAAKSRGFRVYSNTTIYKQTDMHEIAVLFDYLRELDVDGFMLSPAFGYASVEEEEGGTDDLFLTREEVHERFKEAESLLGHHRLTASPIFMDFLTGRRDLTCASWANPTRNVRGWKGPCYLLTDQHYATYQELIDSTDWDALGPGRDPRCTHCLTHCGFEPAAVLEANRHVRDMVRMAVWQMG